MFIVPTEHTRTHTHTHIHTHRRHSAWGTAGEEAEGAVGGPATCSPGSAPGSRAWLPPVLPGAQHGCPHCRADASLVGTQGGQRVGVRRRGPHLWSPLWPGGRPAFRPPGSQGEVEAWTQQVTPESQTGTLAVQVPRRGQNTWAVWTPRCGRTLKPCLPSDAPQELPSASTVLPSPRWLPGQRMSWGGKQLTRPWTEAARILPQRILP